MAEGGSKGLFRALLETLDLTTPESTLTLDAALMVALADGDLSLAERDALQTLLRDGDLSDTTWPEVVARAEELEADAPFFTETRSRLTEARWPPGGKERAIAAAAKVGTAGTPLADEQRAFFDTLVKGLGLAEAHAQDLLPPWRWSVAPADALAPIRPGYCDPTITTPTNLFDALSRAEGELLRVLTFKLSAPRNLASTFADTVKIGEVGTTAQIGHRHLRIDAVIEAEGHEYWVRCIAPGEALFFDEHDLWPELVNTLADHQRLVVAHRGPLYPADAAAIEALGPERVILREV